MRTMTTPRIVIEPQIWNGWELEYASSHDGQSDYRAEKDGCRVFAPTLHDMIERISEAEDQTVRLSRPICIRFKREYSEKGWERGTVFMLHNGVFYYRAQNGEVMHDSCKALDEACNAGPRARLKFILDTKDNEAKLRRASKLRSRAEELRIEADELLKTMEPLTAADVTLGAKL